MKVISYAPPRGRCGNNSGPVASPPPTLSAPSNAGASFISKLSFGVACNEANLPCSTTFHRGNGLWLQKRKTFSHPPPLRPSNFIYTEPDKQDTTNPTLKVRDASSQRLSLANGRVGSGRVASIDDSDPCRSRDSNDAKIRPLTQTFYRGRQPSSPNVTVKDSSRLVSIKVYLCLHPLRFEGPPTDARNDLSLT